MQTCVSLVKFTQHGLQTMKEKGIERAEMVKQNAKALGGKLVEAYYCLGQYDVVAVWEFPDNKTAMRAAVLNASMGHIEITTMPAIGLLLPLVLYVVYTKRVLPGLRVFKHTLRGLSYARLGRYRPALISLRRAVQLDPTNRLARETLWEVHRDLDAARIASDPELIRLIDPHLCLDRAAALLLADRPTDAQIGADQLVPDGEDHVGD